MRSLNFRYAQLSPSSALVWFTRQRLFSTFENLTAKGYMGVPMVHYVKYLLTLSLMLNSKQLFLLSCHNSLCPYSWQNSLSMSKHFFVLATNQKSDLLWLCLNKRALFQLFWGAPWPCLDGHYSLSQIFWRQSFFGFCKRFLGLNIICSTFLRSTILWLKFGHF